MRSLRFRVAAAAFVAVALILVLVGFALIRGFAGSERSALDSRLARRALPALRTARDVLLVGLLPRRGPAEELLSGNGDAIRVLREDRVVYSVGDPAAAGLPPPGQAGLQTVDGPSGRWRALVISVPEVPGARVEVVSSLASIDNRVSKLEQRVIVLGLIALAGVATAGWFLAGATLRSLQRLRAGAARITSTENVHERLPGGPGPVEVRELAAALNAMLERLESSSAETARALEATRRFAADAGHELRTPLTAIGANLDILQRNPRMDEGQRMRVMEALAAQQERVSALLGALQALARGDAGAALPRSAVDLAELTDAAVSEAQARHPGVRFEMEAPEDGTTVEGWEPGLRLALDNLLDNAARHGGADGGRVAIRLLGGSNGAARIVVEDDGQGVPEQERAAIFERFQRGAGARGSGSGLGLSLVAQQAALHSGRVDVGDSALGGARFELVLGNAKGAPQAARGPAEMQGAG